MPNQYFKKDGDEWVEADASTYSQAMIKTLDGHYARAYIPPQKERRKVVYAAVPNPSWLELQDHTGRILYAIRLPCSTWKQKVMEFVDERNYELDTSKLPKDF